MSTYLLIDRGNMIPDKIFEIGAMLGLQREDIQNIVLDESTVNVDLETSSSPVDMYPKTAMYSTISLKDFEGNKGL